MFFLTLFNAQLVTYLIKFFVKISLKYFIELCNKKDFKNYFDFFKDNIFVLTLFLHAQFFKIKKFYFLFFVILQIIFTNSVFADVPMPNSVRQIALEATHTCALTTDDNLWC